MTNAPTSARPEPRAQAAAADVTAIDVAARGPLLMLLGSGIIWLVVSGLLSLITSIQIHSPQLFSHYSFLTYGRADAMRESAFIYGWAGNAGLAIALWLLGRLGGNPLRGANWAFVGASFWNIAVLAGLIGIGAGYMTSFSFFELPKQVQPILVVAYAAIAIPGIVAWSGRRQSGMFASQWYAAAALFLFPWLSSIAQLVLLWQPMRGVGQAVAASWYAQGVWTLWLAPLALAGAYFVTAKVRGKALPNYDAAPLGFWALVFIGAWTGGRHLIGGPVPAWVATIGTVASVLLLVHYIIVGLNLRAAFGVRGTAIGFIRFGVVAYLLAGFLDAITAFRGVAVDTQFTFFTTALEQLGLYGGVSMMFFGAIYFMVPRLTGAPWASVGLTVGHRVLVTVGVIVLVVALGVAGLSQGTDLLNAKTPFADIIDHAKLPLLIVSGVQFILLGANLLLLVNFLQSISSSVIADVTALNPLQQSSEVSAT